MMKLKIKNRKHKEGRILIGLVETMQQNWFYKWQKWPIYCQSGTTPWKKVCKLKENLDSTVGKVRHKPQKSETCCSIQNNIKSWQSGRIFTSVNCIKLPKWRFCRSLSGLAGRNSFNGLIASSSSSVLKIRCNSSENDPRLSACRKSQVKIQKRTKSTLKTVEN